MKALEEFKSLGRFGRVWVCCLSALVIVAMGSLLATTHGWKQPIAIVCATVFLVRYVITSTAEMDRELKFKSSICGDNSGPDWAFCTLEPNHPGDHKNFHSSGGCIGWPQKDDDQ
jgi:hypothetical protein